MKEGRIAEGLAHVLNPAKLDPVDSVDFCGACHRTWADVMEGGMVGVATVRFQPYRLETSRCWGKGDARITCLACHDPHQPLAHDPGSYDNHCLRCHLAAKGSKGASDHPGAACPRSTKDCATCHMPKYEVPGTHTRFTDLQGTASPCRAKAPPLAKRGQDAHATAGETPALRRNVQTTGHG